MENTTSGNTNQYGDVPQSVSLSFYEENYILEPEDYEADNGYLSYEGDFESGYNERYAPN